MPNTSAVTFFTLLAAMARAMTLNKASSQCCGQIVANSKSANGPTGQLSDGQVRIGGGYLPSTYCFNNGAFTDMTGKGCIITPWESGVQQLQCDQGKPGK
jgi:uncharacterized membrane protein